MMEFGTQLTALVTATAVAAGGVAGVTSGDGAGSTSPTALVIDAEAAKDGRDLVDDRLQAADAEVRLPRTAAEARTNVLYLAELGKRVVVAGPHATAAANSTGVAAVKSRNIESALAAAGS
jgi:hypothetical protein